MTEDQARRLRSVELAIAAGARVSVAGANPGKGLIEVAKKIEQYLKGDEDEITVAEECDPEEGLHVALNGERRCMCPEKIKIA
jgi:hypothetical protein